MPETSVIIPFHERLEWTKQSIYSVLSQTYQDFEIIVIDDGSAENHAEDIESLDKRIKYIRQPQKGAGAARNAGVKLASGDFIAFLDSDDLYLPEKLAVQIPPLKEDPDLLLIHASYLLMDESGNIIKPILSGTFTGNVYPEIFFDCPIATPTVVVRRHVFDLLAFEERARFGQDTILWAKIAKMGSIRGIEHPLAKVRAHGKNAAYNPDKQLEGLKNILAFGVRSDTDLQPTQRRRIEAAYFLKFSDCYIAKKEYGLACVNILKSFLFWPSNKKWYIALGKSLFPEKLQRWIKRLLRHEEISQRKRSRK